MKIDLQSAYNTTVTNAMDYKSAAKSLIQRQNDVASVSSKPTGENAAAVKEDAALHKACRDFESVLVSQMLSSMRSTVQKADLFGSDKKEEMFQSMLDNEIAKNCSEDSSFKMGDMIYQQLSKKYR